MEAYLLGRARIILQKIVRITPQHRPGNEAITEEMRADARDLLDKIEEFEPETWRK
jgi:hypothetical protein